MTLDRETEQAAWQALVESPGWQLLCVAVNTEWGDRAVVARMRHAVASVPSGDAGAQKEAAGRVLAGRDAIDMVLNLPGIRIKALEAQPVESEPVVRARRA